MCGVIGLVVEKQREDLGRIAAELLETLEYRGYDSTGGAFQGEDTEVRLVKGVGAPSQMVHELGIVGMSGHIFCGQVRWATFGAVDEKNSQPHQVCCKVPMYGAHNGNVTNCDDLKQWLELEGHQVVSDNDGEMVVHLIEHFFAVALNELRPSQMTDPAARKKSMRQAIVNAGVMLEGSYAAVVVDPQTHTMWSIKQGSSLYFGTGENEKGGRFQIASSDLSSVLQLTRVLVPLKEGQFVEYDGKSYQAYDIKAASPVELTPVRSRLRAKDTALLPQFDTFMEQEISAQEQTVRNVVTVFSGGTQAAQALLPYIKSQSSETIDEIVNALELLRDQYEDHILKEHFHRLVDLPSARRLLSSIPDAVQKKGTQGSTESLAERFVSSESGFFADLLPMVRDADDIMILRVLDVMLAQSEVDEFEDAVNRFTAACTDSLSRGGRLFVVCCGSSYNAAKAATLFFNEVAGTEIVPVLPGEFRGQYANALKDGDLFIAISQSGETKDLIDVLNAVILGAYSIGRVAIVNNINSTLAQEKCDIVIPLRCGPETAVPATKSFMNQMAVLYCLALKLAECRFADKTLRNSDAEAALKTRLEKLPNLPILIKETFDSTDEAIEQAAQSLFLEPSVHILGTRINAVAKEGALKIREVVLNHTEGFEGSEFKHGPNTILGFNTVFGPSEVNRLLKNLSGSLDAVLRDAEAAKMGTDSMRRLSQAVLESVFSMSPTPFSLDVDERLIMGKHVDHQAQIQSLYSDYPLIYVTGPDEKDLQLTTSALNTHKIRGSKTIVIAEEHVGLRQAATKSPADNPDYQSVFITLPRTNDTLMTVFSATVVLQRLALKMSKLKMAYLDRLNIPDHGVHPDVPKNVSKSITVD
jgi:glucosamine--fructose-6-phosphate aminotransferase (isomerizing)